MDSSVIVFCLGLLWLWFRKVHFEMNHCIWLTRLWLIIMKHMYPCVSISLRAVLALTVSSWNVWSLIRFSQNTSAWFGVFNLNIPWLKIFRFSYYAVITDQTSLSDQNYPTSDSISAIRSKIPIFLADGFHVEPVPAKRGLLTRLEK